MEISNKISKIEQSPLISVIVPAYNIEEYLPRCLESILNQSYKNIEIVLVDDGSTDHTAEIADRYQMQYPQKIVCLHMKNGGVLKARLEGIAVASGDWIGFVDGDDEIEENMYERLITNAYRYEADISHCGYQTIVNGGERIHYFYNTGRIVERDRNDGIRDLLSGTFVEPGLWNKLFKKSLFTPLEGEDILKDLIKINEDLLINYLLFKQAKKLIYEDFCPYHYMSRGTSATRSQFNVYKIFDPIKVRKFIFDDVEIANKDIACQKYLIRCMYAYTVLNGNEEYTEKCLELKKELLKYRNKWNLLKKTDLVKLKIILISPTMYKAIYRFYEKYFQKTNRIFCTGNELFLYVKFISVDGIIFLWHKAEGGFIHAC